MSNRRALVVAPLYDGKWLPPLSGAPTLLERLVECLAARGGYDVKTLSGIVRQKTCRQIVKHFFDTPGEVLFYFYGHGCLGLADLGYVATTDAEPFAEGLSMFEVNALAQQSPASEVVLIYDCCHAGASTPVNRGTFESLGNDLTTSTGRSLLAACAAHQSGWETSNSEHRKLGAFSGHILDGLEGAALPRNSTRIRASTLGEYVTRQFQEWNQDPLSYTREAGTKHCVITSGFQVPTELGERKNARLFGTPFKPSQLFVGRSAEIDGLINTLIDGERPVAVSATVEGLGGIGKTELVLQLLHHPEILATYDAIVWLDGAGPLAPQWEKLSAEAGISLPKKRPENFLESLEKGLDKLGSVLVVLDNATDWASVAEWVPVESPLLVTTRTRDFGGNRFIHTELGVLTDEAATSFLTEMIPEIVNDKGLSKLITLLGGHALALELAGWNMKYVGLSSGEYIDRLKKHTEDSEFAISAIRYGNTVDGCLELTWNSLRLDASRMLWRRASLFAPTSAHRDLLRVSASGSAESRYEVEQMIQYLEESELEDLAEIREAKYMAEVILPEPSQFDEAYAELRAFHVLARVEGFNGERWAMHRIVRDFGRARVRKRETMAHDMAISDWLRNPSIPLRPEIPHIVATILDSARQKHEYGERYFAREFLNRASPSIRAGDLRHYLEFIRDELNDPKALNLILEGLADINEDVRIQSIRLLEEVGPIPEVFEALQSSLDDPDRAVRRRAGATLAKHGGNRTIEILTEASRGANIPARLTAVQALGLMGKKAHVALKEAIKSGDELVQIEAALLLCEQKQEEGVSVLLEKQKAVPHRQKHRLVVALGKSRNLKAIDALADLLEDSSHRQAAIEALEKIGSDRASELIEPYLGDAKDEVRCAAARAIDHLNPTGGIELIIDAFSGTEPTNHGRYGKYCGVVQKLAMKRKVEMSAALQLKLLCNGGYSIDKKSCAAALGDAGYQDAVEPLIELLSDYSRDVRIEAANSLGKIGDRRAISVLKKLSKSSSDKNVRKAAKAAIDLIGRK